MKSRFLALLAPLLTLAVPAHAQPPPDRDSASDAAVDEINMAVGEAKTVSARGVKDYSEGAPGVVETKLSTDNTRFVINGRKPGTTTLLLIRSDGTQQTYTINVFARSPVAVERELRQLLDGLGSVKIRRVGARFVLGGFVADEAERARVEHVASLYPGQVEPMVGVGAPLGAGATDEGGKRFLVRIDFYFVQMDKTSGYAVGLGWPRSVGTQASGVLRYDFLAGNVSQAAVTVNQPLPRLDMAADHGWGKVLKHATVVTNSGAEAKFQSGGEQNFTVNTGLTVGLQSIVFGLDVGVTPRFDPTRRDVELRIAANVSDLATPGGGSTVPGRTTSRISTNVNVKLGQSIVLSGIRSKTQTHNVSGIPLLSQIPVLGALFGSHQNAESETEGAIYIVPNVIDAVPTASMELVDSAVQKFKDYSGNVKNARLWSEPPDARPAPRP